jgi:hypothetical protein
VTVNGEVSISNRPFVAAAQDGEWRVSLAGTAPVTVTNTAAVTMAPPDVIRRGGRYEITWSGGEREIVTVAAIGEGAWVRIERTGVESRTRWVNLSMARAIVEAAAAK